MFFHMNQCSKVNRYKRFDGTYYFHLQDRRMKRNANVMAAYLGKEGEAEGGPMEDDMRGYLPGEGGMKRN
jgi:hypothetical protein